MLSWCGLEPGVEVCGEWGGGGRAYPGGDVAVGPDHEAGGLVCAVGAVQGALGIVQQPRLARRWRFGAHNPGQDETRVALLKMHGVLEQSAGVGAGGKEQHGVVGAAKHLKDPGHASADHLALAGTIPRSRPVAPAVTVLGVEGAVRVGDAQLGNQPHHQPPDGRDGQHTGS